MLIYYTHVDQKKIDDTVKIEGAISKNPEKKEQAQDQNVKLVEDGKKIMQATDGGDGLEFPIPELCEKQDDGKKLMK